ncbi:transcription termination factor 2 isoform X2 [Leptopilina boulardi]|uniref:transcription termination factor 2 isoform X2 n=1 Tax=Leptopilina boulardi TaxID=63433 RepID=UPI0021F62007|nr:transcription termination factor 2 isoform X2 [Leptopilina boulardi]
MNKWRDNSRNSDILVVSDSDDEVPGSLEVSKSSYSTPKSLTYLQKRKPPTSPTVIEATDSEDEEDDLENTYESDKDDNTINESDANDSQKIDNDDEEEEEEEEEEDHIENNNSSDGSGDEWNGDKKKDTDSSDDFDVPVKRKSNKTKKFQIHDDSSDEENSVKQKPQRKSDISDDSFDDENSVKQKLQRKSVHHDISNDSPPRIEVKKNLNHSSILEIEDSIEEHSDEREPLSISNSSAPDIAISLAKGETSSSNIDPIVVQEKLLKTHKLQKLQNDLLKAKNIYRSVNRDQLPDRGEKLRMSIETLKEEIHNVSVELENYPKFDDTDLSVISIKDESTRSSHGSRATSQEPEFIPLGGQSGGHEMGKKAMATFEREKALTVERIEHLQQSLNRCPEENEEAENPRGLKTKLMPHQKHALAWMLWREKERPPGGLLADDMGLGKTLTMISLIVATKDESHSDYSESDDDEGDKWSNNKKFGRPKGGTLVICPASLLEQWQNEVSTRCKRGVLLVELYHGQKREIVAKRLARNDMVITTYQLVSSEFKKSSSILFKIRWKRIILDEAHVIRNHSGKISEATCNLSARSRWALTGTPIQNKEQDLYALLKFLRVTPFNDLQVWKRWVDNKNATGLKRLSTVTKTLMLRRTKQELIAKGSLEELPEKFVNTISIELDNDETKIYQLVLAYSRSLFAQFLTQRAEKNHLMELNAGKFDKLAYMNNIPDSQFVAAQKQLFGHRGEEVKSHHILVLILRLRQLCCHPGLIKEMLSKDEAETNGMVNDNDDNELANITAQINNMTLIEDEENEENSDDQIFSSKNPIFNFDRKSSKIAAIIETVKEISRKREKMIIVSQWTGMLEIIGEHLSAIDINQWEMFSGSVPVKKRQGIIDRFNDPDDSLEILLLSLTAGGVGLNLVGGNNILLVDIHWNPQLESQAQDRVYRFGQKKNVHIYKFLCKDTIEQRVKELQDKKLNLAEDIFTGHRRTSNKLSLDDLKNIFEM